MYVWPGHLTKTESYLIKVYIPLTDNDFGQQGFISIDSGSMHLGDRIQFLDISIFFPDVFLGALTHLKEIYDFYLR